MECATLPTIKYSDFSQRMHEANRKNRLASSVSLEVTFRCNLKCKHCYIACSSTEKEMDTHEMRRMIDTIVDGGCLWLLITGGEPLIRPDFVDLYTYAKKKGLIITLFTNGTLMTPRLADYLAEWRPFRVEITLYGAARKLMKG